MPVLQDLAHLSDIPMDVEVQLGRRVLTVRDILQLESGSLIKMSRSAGDNIDVLVGGALVGFGEIVIIEETVGVRITDFISEE
jgi:flagellar motor switch protein FliN/FliY